MLIKKACNINQNLEHWWSEDGEMITLVIMSTHYITDPWN